MKIINNITAVPPGTYEGWYWLSDATKPVMLQNASAFEAPLQGIPFVIEGQLYDKAAQRSISIRNVDGRCIITQYELDDIGSEMEQEPRTVLGHRLRENDQPWLKIIDIWKEQPDPLCAGFPVLQPHCSVFTGFTINPSTPNLKNATSQE